MSFFTIPGPIVICNFSARANRHRRYRHRQLSENKLTFSASISIPYTRHNGQLLTKRMHTFIGVDVSCQSNIRRMQNWHWRWWGNPHAYIYQLIKGPSEGDAGFFFLYILLMPSPWNSSSLFTWKAFIFLVFHGTATPASFPLLQLSPLVYRRSAGERLKRNADSSADLPRTGSTEAADELIALFIDL